LKSYKNSRDSHLHHRPSLLLLFKAMLLVAERSWRFAADLVIGGLEAKFRFPEVPIGHAVTGGITLRLVQMVDLLRVEITDI
jgi:hypothetical protein